MRGRPLGLPKIEEPTDKDVEKWHAHYCAEVTRIFETYRGELDDYAKKEIYID